MENPIKIGWFGDTIIFGNTHMFFQEKNICEHFTHIKCEAPRTWIWGEDKGLDIQNDS